MKLILLMKGSGKYLLLYLNHLQCKLIINYLNVDIIEWDNEDDKELEQERRAAQAEARKEKLKHLHALRNKAKEMYKKENIGTKYINFYQNLSEEFLNVLIYLNIYAFIFVPFSEGYVYKFCLFSLILY